MLSIFQKFENALKPRVYFINKTPAKQRDFFPRHAYCKKSMAKERIEPTTYWLGNTKKFQAPARDRTHELLARKAISEVHLTPWSGDKVEFWQNL